MDWVVDCSIALALCLPDEDSEQAEYFFNEARRAVFWVPSLWGKPNSDTGGEFIR
jgi:hypothetical protein